MTGTPPRLARQPLRPYLVPIVTVLLALVCLSLVSNLFDRRYQQRLHDHFMAEINHVTEEIRGYMTAYGQILRGGSGLFSASDEVRRDDWRHYVEQLGLDEVYRGIQGVGFSQHVPPDRLDAYQQEVRSQGFPDFLVTPPGERETYTSIIYLEPFSGRNLRAFGFDMLSEPVRRAAMERARDTGLLSVSGKVRLLQESDTNVQAGILAYYPVYARGTLPQTVAQRREALVGWTYSPYRMKDLVDGMIREDLKGLRLEIFDEGGQLDEQTLLYDSHPTASQPVESALLVNVSQLEVGGRTWTLRFSSLPSFAAAAAISPPWAERSAMLLICLLLFGITWALINTQRRAERIAREMTLSLRESQEHFRTIFEQAAIGIVQIDPRSRRLLRVNQRFCRMLGYSRHELERLATLDLSHPDDATQIDLQLRELDERAVTQISLEKRYLHKDGHILWVNITASAVFAADGQIHYYLAMVEDITPRKHYEAALRDNEQQLREQSQRLADVIWGTDVGTWEWNVQTGAVVFNERLVDIVGYTLDELAPISIATWLRLLHPEDTERSEQALQRCFRRESDLYECEARMRHKNGEWIWVLDRGRVVEWTDDGLPLRMSGTHLDITARKQDETRLQLAASVFTHAREGIVISDRHGNIVEINSHFSRITGYQRQDILGKPLDTFKSARHTPAFYQSINEALAAHGYWSGEIWSRRKSGDLYLAAVTVSLVHDAQGRVQNHVTLFSDVTLMRAQQEQLEHLAYHDVLTRLPNRMLFADRLQQAMALSNRTGKSLAVLYLDLDGFKAVNDNHGHDVGDELLVSIGQRLKLALREIDTLARIGGDEFAAVLVGLERPEDCKVTLERLLGAAAEPVMVGELRLEVTASVGAALYPHAGTTAEQLLYQADQAMYQAKKAGKNRYCLFDRMPLPTEDNGIPS